MCEKTPEKIPTLELLICAEQELARRRAEYPHEVNQMLKTQAEAEYGIECQAEIVATLERLNKVERTIATPCRLFSANFAEMFDD